MFFSEDQRIKIEVEELTPALRRDSSSLSSSLKSQHLYTPSPTLGRPHTLIPSSPLLVIDSQTEPFTPRAPGFNIYQSYPNKIPGINKYESNLESNNYTSQSFPEDLGLNLQYEYCLMERKQDNTKPKPDLIENKQFKSESSDQDYTLQDQVKLAKDQDYILQDQVKLAKDQQYILQDQVILAKEYKIKEDKTEDVYNMTNNVSKMVIDEYYVMDSSLPEVEDYCIMETTKKNEMKNRKNPDEYCLMEKKSQGMNVIIPQSDKTKPTDENQEYCTMFPKSVPTKPNHLNLSGRQTKSSKLGLTLFTGTSVPQGSSFQSNLSPISPQPCKLDRGTGDEAGLQFEYSRSGSPSRSYLENRRVSFSPDSEPKSKSRVDLQVLKKNSILQVLIGQYDTGTSRTVYSRF